MKLENHIRRLRFENGDITRAGFTTLILLIPAMLFFIA